MEIDNDELIHRFSNRRLKSAEDNTVERQFCQCQGSTSVDTYQSVTSQLSINLIPVEFEIQKKDIRLKTPRELTVTRKTDVIPSQSAP